MDSSGPEEAPEWPLSFRDTAKPSSRARFWSHETYRGPDDQPVKIMYSRTKLESEEIAQEFLGESILGFDMESVNPHAFASIKKLGRC